MTYDFTIINYVRLKELIQQARHSDISVTNKYLKSAKVAHEETKHFEGEL